MWFVPLLRQEALDVLELGLGGPLTGDSIQEAIGYDLSVNDVEPKLFLPGLAGLTQGPGFPNLSCLGRLSDRVLGSDIFSTDTDSRSAREQQSVR
jgi:mycobactin lysine-N-oxygenase